MRAIKKILKSRWVDFSSGIVLAVAGVSQFVHEFEDAELAFGAHHGIAIYGLVIAVRALVDARDGIVGLGEAIEDGIKERLEGRRSSGE